MTAQYGDLRSLDEWFSTQIIEHLERRAPSDDGLIPESVRERGEPYVHLWATLIFDMEVANDGLAGFFENPCGSLAPAVRDAFEQIGPSGYAAVMTQLIAALGLEYPFDYLARNERMAADPAFQEKLEHGHRAIDVWSEDFITARINYARRHGIIS